MTGTIAGFAQISINVGASGIADGPDLSYTHIQSTAAAVWTVNHNLGKNPSVTVVDSANEQVLTEIHYINLNQLQIISAGAFSGQAYCN